MRVRLNTLDQGDVDVVPVGSLLIAHGVRWVPLRSMANVHLDTSMSNATAFHTRLG